MKNIYRLFTAALVLLGAAACNPSEINTPDNPDTPEQPDHQDLSEINITACILQTKVGYTSTVDGFIEQYWQKGDILYGFYDNSISNTISFKVDNINSTTGVATLVPNSESDKQTLMSLSNSTPVFLIYSGGRELSVVEGSLYVDMTGQSVNDERLPACMSAKAFLVKNGDNISMVFFFKNDCAFIEIDSLTGIKGNSSFPGTIQDLYSIEVSNLLLHGKYSLVDDDVNVGEKKLVFSGNGDPVSHIISLGLGWSVNNQGNITGSKSILVAVAPNSTPKSITVTATADKEYAYSGYTGKTFAAGYCYVISAYPVAARTDFDNQYFGTVEEAFNHASELSESVTDNNVVTLVAECETSGKITTDYPVTLDLNGHTLTMNGTGAYTEFFSVVGSEFTIKDSRTSGRIDADTDYGIIVCDDGATVIIDGGILQNLTSPAVLNWEGRVYVNGGEVKSVNSFAIENYDEVIISEGKVNSQQSFAIISIDGYVTIGNQDSNQNDREDISIYANSAAGAIYCEGGGFNVYYGNVEGKGSGPAVTLTDDVTSTISGGYLESSSEFGTLYIHDGPECTISGGTICNKGVNGSCPAVFLYANNDDGTTLEVKWPENKDNDNDGYIITGEGKHEPLLYSSGNDKYSSPIRKTHSNNSKDYSTLKLSGGYLISNNSAFYAQDVYTAGQFDPMTYNVFNGFYANTPILNKSANADPLISVSLVDGSRSDYLNYEASSAGDGFTISSSLSTGGLYIITQSGSQGAVTEYQFINFVW